MNSMFVSFFFAFSPNMERLYGPLMFVEWVRREVFVVYKQTSSNSPVWWCHKNLLDKYHAFAAPWRIIRLHKKILSPKFHGEWRWCPPFCSTYYWPHCSPPFLQVFKNFKSVKMTINTICRSSVLTYSLFLISFFLVC